MMYESDSRDTSAPPDFRGLSQQFSSDAPLRLRQAIHDAYSVPKVDFSDWALKRVEWRGDERVLDVGTGSGQYAERVRSAAPDSQFFGVDRFAGMLEHHPTAGRVACADALHLPFGDARFDVVMANHMLYLVPDVDATVRELRRVLRPGGVLIAATNSSQTMPEFTALFRRAVMLLTSPGSTYNSAPLPPSAPFTLENGPQLLHRHFFAVVRHDLPQALVFDQAEPALDYLESGRSLRESQLPPGVRWEEVMLIMREQIDRVIAHFGELVVNKVSGVLVASDRGGFIRGYVTQRAADHSR